MKSTQTLNELRTMDAPELDARLKEVRTELFNLRFQAATGQLENHRQIRNVRRQIAQVLTVLQGRQLGIDDIISAEAAAATPAPARGADRAQVAAAQAEAVSEPEAAPEDEVEAEAATGVGERLGREAAAEETPERAEEASKAEATPESAVEADPEPEEKN